MYTDVGRNDEHSDTGEGGPGVRRSGQITELFLIC